MPGERVGLTTRFSEWRDRLCAMCFLPFALATGDTNQATLAASAGTVDRKFSRSRLGNASANTASLFSAPLVHRSNIGPNALEYRADIDGLRAIAVLSVVVFHAFPETLRGGFIGVDIFFVISGYLITRLILTSTSSGRFRLIEFYRGRIRRIFPALLLVLAASLAFGWLALLPDEYTQLGKHVAAGAGFVSNFVLWNESGYFDNTALTKPLLHLWSLGIEEQFYIIWPIVVILLWRFPRAMWIAIVGGAVLSFGINIKNVEADRVAAFYSPQARFWELMAGSAIAYLVLAEKYILAQVHQRWARPFRLYLIEKLTWLPKISPSFIGCALLVVGLVATREDAFPGWWALLPVLGTALVICAGPNAWINREILSHRLLVWCGLISYPLYLWHWPLLSFSRIVNGHIASTGLRLLLVATAIGLATLTYLAVERPIRYGSGRARAAVLLAVAMVVVGFAGYACFAWAGLPSRPAIKALDQVSRQFEPWKYYNNDVCLDKYKLPGREAYGWWFCMANRSAPPTLMLLGNSFANQFYPGFAANPNLNQHSILSIGTCQPYWVEPTDPMQPLTSNPCTGRRWWEQQTFINNIVETSGSVRFAVMMSLENSAAQGYIDRVRKRIDFLEANGVRVIAFLPHFYVNKDVRTCFGRPFGPVADCDIPAADIAKVKSVFQPVVDSISTTNPKVAFFDPNVLFCTNGRCSMVRDGMPLYRDAIHLSEFGSIELGKIFADWARGNLPELLR
jgi:peptidoglycan/LPS O-acetylase OafA/YrhL